MPYVPIHVGTYDVGNTPSSKVRDDVRSLTNHAKVWGLQGMGGHTGLLDKLDDIGWNKYVPNDIEGQQVNPIIWDTAVFERVDVFTKQISPRTYVGPVGVGDNHVDPRFVNAVYLKHRESNRVFVFLNFQGVGSVEERGLPLTENNERLNLYERNMENLQEILRGIPNRYPKVLVGNFQVDYRCDKEVQHSRFPYHRLRNVGLKNLWEERLDAGGTYADDTRLVSSVWYEQARASNIGILFNNNFDSDHYPVRSTLEIETVRNIDPGPEPEPGPTRVPFDVLKGRGFPHFRDGVIFVHRPNILRIYARNPVIENYYHVYRPWNYPGVLPTSIIRPINFRAGRIEILIPGQHEVIPVPTGSGVNFTNGRIIVSQEKIAGPGALSNFAFYPASAPDPADIYFTNYNNINSGAVGSPWTRHYVTFAVPRGSRIMRRGQYLGVGARFIGVPSNTKQYMGQVQLEPAPLDGRSYPTSYTQARQAEVIVVPERLNYSANPGFEVDVTGWTSTAPLAKDTTVFAVGTASGRVDIPLNASGYIRHAITGLIPGRRYMFSAHYRSSQPRDLVGAINSGGTLAYNRSLLTTDYPDWKRHVVAFKANHPDATVDLSWIPGPAGALYIDAVLVEQGETLRGYFDGASGPDYLWESGGIAGKARSYYYKNRASRFAAMRAALAANVPMGLGVAEPRLAVRPPE